MEQGPLGLNPELRTHRYQRRTSERARATEYWPGTTPPTKSALLPASSLATCDLVSQFLLGIHADHRIARGQVLSGLVVEVGELGVTVGVLPALDRLGVALQAEALLMQ